jgi:predicted dehydrogenase
MIKWGIVGLGNMASRFANAIKEVNNAKLVAVSSQSNSKLNLFATEYNINNELKFNNYKSLAECKEIDAVYISTLNNTHSYLINLFAVNKKNILCEKPFCINIEEGIKLKKIIEDNNVKFFEAIAYLSHPQTNEILNLVESREIGEVNNIKLEFGFKVKKINPKSRLFNKELGGGAILDLGCYPISFLSLFSNDNKNIIFNKCYVKKCNTNVDIEANANLTINDKINCDVKISLNENLENFSTIYGSKGSLIVNQPWLPEKKVFLEINSKERYFKKFINSELTIYAEQIKNVSNEFLGKNNSKKKLFNIDKSLNNMKYLDKWMNETN